MKILFLDESGDHNLSVIDPQYPIFVLGGVIMDEDYAKGPLTDALDEFKDAVFGRTDIVLHTADITRNRNGFESMKEASFRDRFYSHLNELMRTLSYSVVACAIRKSDYLSRFGLAALDPYLISLDIGPREENTALVRTSNTARSQGPNGTISRTGSEARCRD